MQDYREMLLSLLDSAEFRKVYDQYLRHAQTVAQDGKDLLESHIEKIKTPECYIAILGIQGAGKSSLLNALIFEDEVLPVAVEETTCIPTLIRRVYEKETVGAEVHFRDGRVEQMPLERQFLEKVVDNRYNPGNIMDALFVVCRTDARLVQQGFVFVDLPGVGSLTEKNEQTTMRFLQKTSIGIFLLRTVPPITESEAGFIKIAWPRLQQSIFVQNLWAQETGQEVGEGMAHNEKVLSKIAEMQHSSMPKQILPVNVSLACQASFSKDERSLGISGLSKLEEEIHQYAQASSLKSLYAQTAQFFIRLLDRGKQQLQERLNLFQQDRQGLIQKFQEAQAQFDAHKVEWEAELQRQCSQFQEKINEIKNTWLAQALDQTLDNLLKRLDRMPLEDLKEDQFRHEIRIAFSDLFGVVYREMRQKLGQAAEEYVQNLGETMSHLTGWNKIFGRTWDPDSATPQAKASGLSVALAGSIAPMLIAGPIGWTILGGALITGTLVRWASGSTLHQRIMRGLRKALSDGKSKMWQDLSEEVSQFFTSVQDAIVENLRWELKSYEAELSKIQAGLHQAAQDQETQYVQLQQGMTEIQKWIEALGNIAQQG